MFQCAVICYLLSDENKQIFHLNGFELKYIHRHFFLPFIHCCCCCSIPFFYMPTNPHIRHNVAQVVKMHLNGSDVYSVICTTIEQNVAENGFFEVSRVDWKTYFDSNITII